MIIIITNENKRHTKKGKRNGKACDHKDNKDKKKGWRGEVIRIKKKEGVSFHGKKAAKRFN